MVYTKDTVRYSRLMTIYGRWLPAVLTAFMLVLLAAVWIILAPIQMGGQAAYVIITGNSMEPDFHTGDLVIVQRAPVYKIGDIVAYHNADLERYVFHRIIRKELGRFVLQGDNNTWIDAYLPSQEELIGKLWIHLPSVGKAVQWARLPTNMSLVAGALAGLLMTTLLVGRQRRSPSRKSVRAWFKTKFNRVFEGSIMKSAQNSPLKVTKPKTPNALTVGINSARGWADSLWKQGARRQAGSTTAPVFVFGIVEGLFFLLGLMAFGSLVLGLIAFTRPLLRTVPEDLPYYYTGTFTYTAAATPGIYDLETIRTGEPIFPNLTCTMKVAFSYILAGDQLADLNGTRDIIARVADEISGWQRTILLKPATAFKGGTSSINASLNLCQLAKLTEALEQETNYYPSYYTLSIIPRITVNGKLSGKELKDTYEPSLVFRFDKQQVYLVRDNPTIDPLNPSEMRLLEGTRKEANTIPILGMEPEVGTLRAVTLPGLILSLCGLMFLSMAVARMARNKESYVRMKYGSMLVDVNENSNGHLKPAEIVDLATIDDLAKLADRKNSMILHETRGPVHYYLVQGDGITYRFSLNEREDGLVQVLPAQAEEELRRGFERGEFQVYYQPIVSLADGKITAVEALLRWQHPQRGLIAAKDFILTAEASGMIEPIGEWMLQVACSQLKDWQKTGVVLELAVNFAESQLEKDAINAISRVLKNTGINPHDLQVEIPEKGILKSAYKILPKMQELKDLGIQVSIDNFVGQLPAAYIGKYPINSVKIDRLLVQRIGDSENASAIGEMAASAQSAGVNVVAVGVETEEQLEQLRSQYCAQVQGLFLGDPAPASEITRILLKGTCLVEPKPVKRKPVH